MRTALYFSIAILSLNAATGQTLESWENERQATINRGIDQVNLSFAKKYEFLLQKAKLAGNEEEAQRIQTLMDELKEPEALRAAKKDLVGTSWDFKATKTGYHSTRNFKSDGTWTSSDANQSGQWEIKDNSLLITLKGSMPHPEEFKLPPLKEGWKGIGALGDPVVLTAAADATDSEPQEGYFGKDPAEE